MSDNPANATRFNVGIDGHDLGAFTGLDGLSAKYEVTSYQEGGENGFVHQLPGRLTYENIRLTRPVDLRSTALAVWFHLLSKGASQPRRYTASVVAFNDNGDVVTQWTFRDVWPVGYTGPSFSADTAKVATETFEFAHGGILY
jgi:phage tail-like protein